MVTLPPSGHWPLAPSAAPRWVRCPGSVQMGLRYAQDETEEQREGTAAHEVARMLADRGRAPVVALNGVPVTEDMIAGAELWRDTLVGIAPLAEWHLEEPVLIPAIHGQCGGTPDAWHWNAAAGRLTVPDYKYGHRYVDAFENWSLISYASGILDSLGIDGAADQHVRVELIIVQPRSYSADGPVRSWTVKASDLRGYINKLAASAGAALREEPEVRTGAHCRDCTGRHACKALQQAAYSATVEVGRFTPVDLPPDALAVEMTILADSLEALTHRLSGLQEVALSQVRAGKSLTGWRADRGSGKVDWTKTEQEVRALGAMLGVELTKPKLLTPGQAEKAGIPGELLKQYTERKFGELKLVPDDGTFARRAFFGGV